MGLLLRKLPRVTTNHQLLHFENNFTNVHLQGCYLPLECTDVAYLVKCCVEQCQKLVIVMMHHICYLHLFVEAIILSENEISIN